MSSASLCNLPVELIYHLLEYFDLSTIFFSFRFVCKRFHTIVNSFDQCQLDMRLMSKSDFDRVCHIISPEKVLSIILANDTNTPYQIRTFLSRFSFDQFFRIQSLSLIRIEENNLFSILMDISKSSLQSLTVECASWDTFSYTIRILLSSTIAKSKLEKLDLNIAYRDLDMISWPPLPITLRSLRLERCNFQEYCMILRHAVNLQQLKLTECLMNNSDETNYQPVDLVYPLKLTSLIFGTCFMRMKELLQFLSRTPKLQYLKLMVWTDVSDSVIDGKKWEDFISEKLTALTRFDFFFEDLTHTNRDSVDIKSYTRSFQTPFWTEKNQWYVTCDYLIVLSVIRLYSLPICNALFTYYPDYKRISDSTWKRTANQIELTHRVRELNLNLNEITESDHRIPNNLSPNLVFGKLSRLSLTLDGRYLYTSLPILQTIIDLSSLVSLSIQILIYKMAQNALFTDYISTVLTETSNIHSLKINLIHIEEPYLNTTRICSIIPHSVKHLQISVTNLDEIKNILEQLHHLFSVTFYSPNISKYSEDIKKWIQLKRKDSIYRDNVRSIHIWLGTLIHHDYETHAKKGVFHRLRHNRST